MATLTDEEIVERDALVDAIAKDPRVVKQMEVKAIIRGLRLLGIDVLQLLSSTLLLRVTVFRDK